MNQRDLSEIKRRLNPDRRNPTLLCGCYISGDGRVIASFAQLVGAMPQEENEKYMAIFRRCLSGTAGQNLLPVDFTSEQVENGAEHRLLTRLCDSALADEEAVGEFFQKAVAYVQAKFAHHAQSVEEQQAADNYLLLLMHDGYDVPHRDSNGESDRERSSSILNYILCAMCPVKQSKPALRYFAAESEFHSRESDWVVGLPELGFMFPAFEERGANINRAMYFTRDAGDLHQDFLDCVFKAEPGMTAAEQKESFQAVLEESLQEECSLDVVQTVHEQLRDRIEEQKGDKTAEPTVVSKREVKSMLESCGVPEERMTAFEQRYDDAFGAGIELSARNIVDEKKFEVRTPDVVIQVNPERSDLVETRVIDGFKYNLIRADEGVEVNGVNINIGKE